MKMLVSKHVIIPLSFHKVHVNKGLPQLEDALDRATPFEHELPLQMLLMFCHDSMHEAVQCLHYEELRRHRHVTARGVFSGTEERLRKASELQRNHFAVKES